MTMIGTLQRFLLIFLKISLNPNKSWCLTEVSIHFRKDDWKIGWRPNENLYVFLTPSRLGVPN